MITIKNFVECPEHIPFIAEQVHNQWFSQRPGATVEGMLERMRTGRLDAVPIGLVAFVDDMPAGTVSLVTSDLESRPDLSPWLAGLLVFPEFRNLGIASALVEELVASARRIGEKEVFLYTSIPQFYEKLGWVVACQVEGTPEELVMRHDLRPPASL